MKNYELLDSGSFKKIERFGPYTLIRPSAQAVWQPEDPNQWKGCDASFSRENGNHWSGPLPKQWQVNCSGFFFKVSPTDFGHLGLFPEHQIHWRFVQKALEGQNAEVLNLFAYTGGMTLAALSAKASVTHLDASKPMVSWAKENAKLNQLEKAPVRWIVDDAIKFLRREIKRERTYDAIILDPPSFGRGSSNEVFKIEEDLPHLLDLCFQLLSKKPLFLLLTCHTPALSSTVLSNLLEQKAKGQKIESGETLLPSKAGFFLPAGHFARVIYE
ncbi:MAG: class I SAM-dependent methyltransferase [Simkaniaceae bacterium]